MGFLLVLFVYLGFLGPFKPFVSYSGEAVRLLMNKFKVDGLTRALTRQPSFSLGFAIKLAVPY